MSEKIRRISRGLAIIGMSFIFPLIFLTIIDVLGRGLFDKPLPGTFELSEYLLSIVILLSAGYTQQVKGHVSVDFIIKRFSGRTKIIINLITVSASLFVIGLLIYKGILEALQERTVSDTLRIPQKPFKFLVPIGCSALFWELLVEFIENLQKLRGKMEDFR
jgi:TRAP-type C4-dicarboxylate transport system permease small subunit